MEFKKIINNRKDFSLMTLSNSLTNTSLILGAILVWFISLGIGTYALINVYQLDNQIKLLQTSCDSLKEDIKSLTQYMHFDDDTFDYKLDDQSFEDYGEYGSQEIITTEDILNNLLKTERNKRDIVQTSNDGFPVNSESYDDIPKKNKILEIENLKIISNLNERTKKNDDYPSISKTENEFSRSTSGPTESLTSQYEFMSKKSTSFARKSRVMHFEDSSKVDKKKLLKPITRSSDSTYEFISDERPRGNRNRRRPRRRQIDSFGSTRIRPTIHLHGHIESGNKRRHHNNGHFKHWLHGEWVESLGMDHYFHLNDGYLEFLHPGLYFVYAQIFYVDNHNVNGFYVYKNDTTILQCITSSHSTNDDNLQNTCFTAGIEYFNTGDKLRVRDMVTYRYSVFDKGTSFFGAFKIGHGK